MVILHGIVNWEFHCYLHVPQTLLQRTGESYQKLGQTPKRHIHTDTHVHGGETRAGNSFILGEVRRVVYNVL